MRAAVDNIFVFQLGERYWTSNQGYFVPRHENVLLAVCNRSRCVGPWDYHSLCRDDHGRRAKRPMPWLLYWSVMTVLADMR